MDFDDDAPPDLVEVAGDISLENEGAPPFKVPITIVTGIRRSQETQDYARPF